jgi:hypothetical protein
MDEATTYRCGDHVYPLDLPRKYLCRVVGTEDWKVHGRNTQVLKLQPLEGPWPKGTLLVRADKNVERTAVPMTTERPRGWLFAAFAR